MSLISGIHTHTHTHTHSHTHTGGLLALVRRPTGPSAVRRGRRWRRRGPKRTQGDGFNSRRGHRPPPPPSSDDRGASGGPGTATAARDPAPRKKKNYASRARGRTGRPQTLRIRFRPNLCALPSASFCVFTCPSTLRVACGHERVRS